MKKLLICLTVLFSTFLFTNKVSALELHHIDELELFEQPITEDYIYSILNVDKNKFPYVLIMTSHYDIPVTGNTLFLHIYFYSNNTGIRISDNQNSWSSYSANTFFCNGTNELYMKVGGKKDISNYSTKEYNSKGGGSGGINNYFYYFSNFDILNKTLDKVMVPANNVTINEFTINTYDTEFGGHWFGVNYIQGQQDNTINFYIQDSGILTISAAKGYEIEKIYYDEALTNEANLTDIVETDTNLYVTWKSKIDISKQIATDLSGNDVITINYDFSKIYNENYTYWISNDGNNYVDITDKLNNEHKYNSGVYFAGDYYARVQDENNETISVNYINIDYYRITPTTEIGKDVDENGNIKPYIILDYSAYREIKNNIICEYSIDNGNTWIDITNELDINMKYKLYINIGDKVTSRVRTNGNTILPGETGGSNYDVTEDFYNDILIKEEKDILEEFKNLFKNKNSNIFVKFKEVWESFKDNVLFVYIFILIVGSLIILIIKAANRS